MLATRADFVRLSCVDLVPHLRVDQLSWHDPEIEVRAQVVQLHVSEHRRRHPIRRARGPVGHHAQCLGQVPELVLHVQ